MSIETKYPRLIRAMMWQACLSQSEAIACLWVYLGTRNLQHMSDYSGEAVGHYGGARRVVADAIRNRHRMPARG